MDKNIEKLKLTLSIIYRSSVFKCQCIRLVVLFGGIVCELLYSLSWPEN